MDGEFFLVRRMKGGEEAAMEQFVRKYYDPILSYCCHHTTVYGLAEDLTQETFERFFRSLPTYRHTGKLANYLYVIAGNLCRDAAKKKQELPMEEIREDAEDPFECVNCRMNIQQALGQLPDELREVVILRYFQNLKQREIAGILGIGIPLVKYRMNQAKKKLRDALSE